MGVLMLSDYRADLDAGLQQAVSNTYKDRWVNQALKEFGYAFKFHELEVIKQFVTIANQIGFAIGAGLDIAVTDFRYIEELRKVAPKERLGHIIPETRSRYLMKIGDTTDTTQYGNPKYYHKYGNKIYFRPIPDATLVTIDLQYFKSITGFVAAGDTSPFHEDWDEVIYLGALYRGFRHFGEFDRYQNIRNDFLGIVRSRQTEFELEEFPEGGVNPLGPTDTEDSLVT